VTWPDELGARHSDATGTPCVDVDPQQWAATLSHARDTLGFTVFDWLSAVDEPVADPPSVDVVLHVVALDPLRRLLLRTRVPASEAVLASATATWAGAAWHERETHEMFGVDFTGFDDGSDDGLRPLLLPDGFSGTPLRKSFVLASRAAKAWPGAKDPGESDAQRAPSRRSLLPPGVPDAGTWGPRSGRDGDG
jgi:NADH-quinone oxidoreductase subunit C